MEFSTTAVVRPEMNTCVEFRSEAVRLVSLGGVGTAVAGDTSHSIGGRPKEGVFFFLRAPYRVRLMVLLRCYFLFNILVWRCFRCGHVV